MIDNEKLKAAMNLAEKYYKETADTCVIELNFSFGCKTYLHKLWTKGVSYDCSGIDEIIEKLQSLHKPEPKYKKGQLVWFIDEWNQVTSKVVMRSWQATEICTGEKEWSYDCSMARPLFESQLFPTRQALIENQIEYWRNQLQDELDQHVSPYCEPMSTTQGAIPRPDITASCCKTCSGHGDMRLYAGLGKYMRCKDCNPCQHEYDGQFYNLNCDPVSAAECSPVLVKCIKCGEFYR